MDMIVKIIVHEEEKEKEEDEYVKIIEAVG